MKIRRNYSLKKLSTIKVGGNAEYFISAGSESEISEAIATARTLKVKWTLIGAGSNIVPSDNGFAGLVIRNVIRSFGVRKNTATVGAGNDLLTFIRTINSFGLAGMEHMAGIPGTIGGAIYGCAGAYGQEIKDTLKRVRIFDGKEFRWLSNKQCLFSYRDSIFKRKKDWVIIAAEFSFRRGEAKQLRKISADTIAIRNEKFPPLLNCPGSFFKNIVLADLKPANRKRLTAKIDAAKIRGGKVPAGYLLKLAGAPGMRSGGIRVASYHGNIIYNPGGGTSRDIRRLTELLKRRVKQRFGIELEEEIQYI